MGTTDVELQLTQQLKEAEKCLSGPPTSDDELLYVLDQTEKLLSKVDQSPNDSMQEVLRPLIRALVKGSLLEHSNTDVKVSVASCFSEITRITAPEAPYDDDEMKDVFRLIVSSFENLSDKSSRSYSKRVSILESISKVRSCVIMLDLECEELIVEMFEHFLKSVRDYHLDNIYPLMVDIMALVIEECDDVSLDMIKPLLSSIKNNNSGVLPETRKLGEEVLQKSRVKLRPYLIKAITILGDSLDDYSQTLTSICEDTAHFEHNDESASVQQQQTGEGKLVKECSEEATPQADESKIVTVSSADMESSKKTEEAIDAASEKTLKVVMSNGGDSVEFLEKQEEAVDATSERTLKIVMSNGGKGAGNEEDLADMESLKKPEEAIEKTLKVVMSNGGKASGNEEEDSADMESCKKTEEAMDVTSEKTLEIVMSDGGKVSGNEEDSADVESSKKPEEARDATSEKTLNEEDSADMEASKKPQEAMDAASEKTLNEEDLTDVVASKKPEEAMDATSEIALNEEGSADMEASKKPEEAMDATSEKTLNDEGSADMESLKKPEEAMDATSEKTLNEEGSADMEASKKPEEAINATSGKALKIVVCGGKRVSGIEDDSADMESSTKPEEAMDATSDKTLKIVMSGEEKIPGNEEDSADKESLKKPEEAMNATSEKTLKIVMSDGGKVAGNEEDAADKESLKKPEVAMDATSDKSLKVIVSGGKKVAGNEDDSADKEPLKKTEAMDAISDKTLKIVVSGEKRVAGNKDDSADKEPLKKPEEAINVISDRKLKIVLSSGGRVIRNKENSADKEFSKKPEEAIDATSDRSLKIVLSSGGRVLGSKEDSANTESSKKTEEAIDATSDKTLKIVLSSGGDSVDIESSKKPEAANDVQDSNLTTKVDTDDSVAELAKAESKPEEVSNKTESKTDATMQSAEASDSSHNHQDDNKIEKKDEIPVSDSKLETTEVPDEKNLEKKDGLVSEAANAAGSQSQSGPLSYRIQITKGKRSKKSYIKDDTPLIDVLRKEKDKLSATPTTATSADGKVTTGSETSKKVDKVDSGAKPGKGSGKKAGGGNSTAKKSGKKSNSGNKVNAEGKKRSRPSVNKDDDSDSDNKPLKQSAKKGNTRKSTMVKSSEKNKDGKKQGSGKKPEDDSAVKAASEEEALTTSSKRKRPMGKNNVNKKIKYDTSLVGLKVKVWWPDDQKYYEGVIKSYTKNRHKVLYLDGDVETLDLKNEKWEILEEFSVRNDESQDEKLPEVQNTDDVLETPKNKKTRTASGPDSQEKKDSPNRDEEDDEVLSEMIPKNKEGVPKLVYKSKGKTKPKTADVDDEETPGKSTETKKIGSKKRKKTTE